MKSTKLISDEEIDKILRTEITKKYKARHQPLFSLYEKYKHIKERFINEANSNAQTNEKALVNVKVIQKANSEYSIFKPHNQKYHQALSNRTIMPMTTSAPFFFPKSPPLKSKVVKSISKSSMKPQQPNLPMLILNNQMSIDPLSSTYRNNEIAITNLFFLYGRSKKHNGVNVNAIGSGSNSIGTKSVDKASVSHSVVPSFDFNSLIKRNQITNPDSLNIINTKPLHSNYLSYQEMKRQQEESLSLKKQSKMTIHNKSLDNLLDNILRLIDFHNEKNRFLYRKGVKNLIGSEIDSSMKISQQFITETKMKIKALKEKIKMKEIAVNHIDIKSNSSNLSSFIGKEASSLAEIGYNDSDNDSISHCLSADINHLLNKHYNQHIELNDNTTTLAQVQYDEGYSPNNESLPSPMGKEKKIIKITQRFSNSTYANNANAKESLFNMEKYKSESIRNVLRTKLHKKTLFKNNNNSNTNKQPKTVRDNRSDMNTGTVFSSKPIGYYTNSNNKEILCNTNITNIKPIVPESPDEEVKVNDKDNDDDINALLIDLHHRDIEDITPPLGQIEHKTYNRIPNEDILIPLRQDTNNHIKPIIDNKSSHMQSLIANLSRVPQLSLSISPTRIPLQQDKQNNKLKLKLPKHSMKKRQAAMRFKELQRLFIILNKDKDKHLRESKSHPLLYHIELELPSEIDADALIAEAQYHPLKPKPTKSKYDFDYNNNQTKPKFKYIVYRNIDSSQLVVKSNSMNNEQLSIQVLSNHKSRRIGLNKQAKGDVFNKSELPSHMANTASLLGKDLEGASLNLNKGKGRVSTKDNVNIAQMDFKDKLAWIKKSSYDDINEKIEIDYMALSESINYTRKRELRLNGFMNSLNRDLERYRIIHDYNANKAMAKDKRVIFKSCDLINT